MLKSVIKANQNKRDTILTEVIIFMKTYVALLRGVNVGGKNKIKMADLRNQLSLLGFENVKTYIQSGNIIFDSNLPKTTIKSSIENMLRTGFSIESNVLLRDEHELSLIIKKLPYTTNQIHEADDYSESVSLYVGLLGNELDAENISKLKTFETETEMFFVDKLNVYLLFYESIRNSKLARHLDKLAPVLTTRNWKTINKINNIIMDK